MWKLYRASHKIGNICVFILPTDKIWIMGHMGQVCLRVLLYKKDPNPRASSSRVYAPIVQVRPVYRPVYILQVHVYLHGHG